MFFLYIFAALIVFLIALYIALKLIVRRFVHTKLAQYQSVLDTGDPKRLWPVRIRIDQPLLQLHLISSRTGQFV